jgi:hypothetical protein
MEKLTIFTMYNDKYVDYLNIWLFCIRKSYPTYESLAIKGISKNVGLERFIVWPIKEGDVYITDVDMMILQEVPDIYLFHHEEMKLSGLPYANTPRNNDEPEADRRLTGMHYATQKWYEITELQRKAAAQMLEVGVIGNRSIDDEICLKNICLNSGLGIPPKRPIIPRHPGIHMGTFRNYQHLGRQRLRTELERRISPTKARKWLEIIEDPEGRRIIRDIKDLVIKKEFELLEWFCWSHSKQG